MHSKMKHKIYKNQNETDKLMEQRGKEDGKQTNKRSQDCRCYSHVCQQKLKNRKL